VSLRSQLAKRALPYLEPGEQIQAIFKAQSGLSPYVVDLVSLCALIAAMIVLVKNLESFLATQVLLVILLIVIGTLGKVFVRFHYVVVTDRAIVVLDASRWRNIVGSPNWPTGLRLRQPRNFYFGRPLGLFGNFVLGNTEYWVRMRFHRDVAAADAALSAMMQRRQSGLAVQPAQPYFELPSDNGQFRLRRVR
jgi:hypothetical protein